MVATSVARADSYQPSAITPPPPMREYRAAWIATVANIDWPSTNALTTAQQKAELLTLFDLAAKLNLNTIIFQVRPACDAFYVSRLEPWSEYLTGTMGKAPTPFYDPLAFAIEQAHKRGMELHAWFNPYRARQRGARSAVSANHISRTSPDLVKSYSRYLWLDPGEKRVQDYTLRVVMDVVNRYDIDGVHFDDYFYPYREKDRAGNATEFPDDASWKRFGAGGNLSRDDWRRENVNVMVERVYHAIKATKPWVKFGISPFGIWRPGNPAQIKGYDAYAELYADSRKWLAKGWCDYFSPQLYWTIQPPEQSFPVLLRWWAGQNDQCRHLLPGLDCASANRSPQEIVNQIRLTRKQAGAGGLVLWSLGSLKRNRPLETALRREVFAEPALVPASSWLDRSPPSTPKLLAKVGGKSGRATWAPQPQEKPWLWVVQQQVGKGWKSSVLPGSRLSFPLNAPFPRAVAVSAVDRNGNISRPAVVELRR